MVLETNLTIIFWDTLGGIVKNLPYFILILWGVKKIVKEMPGWLKLVFEEMQKSKVLYKALEKRTW